MTEIIPPFLPVIPALFFAFHRLLSYLHIFQQEEYDGLRFARWLIKTVSIDRRLSLAILAFFLFEVVWHGADSWIASAAVSLALTLFAFLESDPRKHAKKKLILTERAMRILVGAMLISSVMILFVSVSGGATWMWLVPVQLLPINLIVANILLMPFERLNQRRFWLEAHEKLGRLKPEVVGVTGSFGKTSVKHILGHVLEGQAHTLLTPGSVNTPMGIARIVRERLDSHHRFFVCEMGAYGPGSIERLCRLVPPNVAVITAIGFAHYERFKSLDVVARTKLELAEAAVADGGRAIIAEQVLDFAPGREFVADHRSVTTIVGNSSNADVRLLAVRQTVEGTEIDLEWLNKQHTIKAPLHGDQQGINLALVFATAAVMGIPVDVIILSLIAIPQIKHRLEVRQESNGALIVDDAYNSNPIGFASALRTLDILRRANGRRILVTPGMVELGAVHEEEHRKIGTLAGAHVDVLLPVVPTRIRDLINAYRTANPNGLIVPCVSFVQAQAWLSTNLRPEDTVLLENDLPDLYEGRLSL